MAFAKQMLNTKVVLEQKGHQVELPDSPEEYLDKNYSKISFKRILEGANKKINRDLIRKHFKKIEKGDAILVINPDKNSIKGYIGGNSFAEMVLAYYLNKRIYVLNQLPKQQLHCYQELIALQPTVLNGDLDKLRD